jgi:SAM-dependent methyltransferase
MTDPFGRALLDHHRGEKTEPLSQCAGDETLTHPVEEFYFDAFESQAGADWIESWLTGPLLDVGAGAGRDALHFQERFETVALEISESLVALLESRGVGRVEHGDMFGLTDSFEPARFQSLLAVGTQVGLARSMPRLGKLLEQFATVTTADATLVLDAYDPEYGNAPEMLGFRSDPAPGLGHRVIRYEYEGVAGETLLFVLFGPDRLREATTGTDWAVADVQRPNDAYYYRAALQKE